jgi:hypothetical protein
MPVKSLVSQGCSTPSNDSSSEGQDQFVISPHPRRATQKTSRTCEGSTTQADEEATRVAEGHAVVAAREARASDII